jgi:hypothetical protein
VKRVVTVQQALVHGGEEGIVRPHVGPEREDAAGVKFRGENAQTVGAVELSVPLVEEIRRRMIDVEEDRVEESPGAPGIKAGTGRRSEGEFEKVAVDKTAALIRDAFDDHNGLIVCPSASPYIRGAGCQCLGGGVATDYGMGDLPYDPVLAGGDYLGGVFEPHHGLLSVQVLLDDACQFIGLLGVV